VDATSKRCCEASFERSGRGGHFGEIFRPKEIPKLTTIKASRYRARASRRLRRFGGFATSFLVAQPPSFSRRGKRLPAIHSRVLNPGLTPWAII
jgi:hypothetical protein